MISSQRPLNLLMFLEMKAHDLGLKGPDKGLRKKRVMILWILG